MIILEDNFVQIGLIIADIIQRNVTLTYMLKIS